ncbi:hypothetical protein RV12_GL001706 [Enterococcus quebecensis]|nr:hypothetical protein RV12_GL001706 [Enterococcus quebecensis]
MAIMNTDEIVQKVKDLIGEGNFEKAKQFLEEHKDEIGEQYEKLKGMIPDIDAGGLADKVKGFFKK